MKKVLSYLSLLALCLCLCGAVAVQADDTATVYVTISDATGSTQLALAPVTVADIDGDAALTINDALYCAHEQYNPDGTDSYGSYTGDYGLSLGKLWGDESGSFGYYVNNASAWSLADPVAEGDKVNAFIYQDQTAWSDMYTYFDATNTESDENGQVTLTLTGCGFDESWNPISVPVANAQIIVNGEATDIYTDENGTVTLTLTSDGRNLISAQGVDSIIVPPLCYVNVAVAESTEADSVDEAVEVVEETVEAVEETVEEAPATLPQTGLVSSFLFVALGTALVGSGAGVIVRNKKN